MRKPFIAFIAVLLISLTGCVGSSRNTNNQTGPSLNSPDALVKHFDGKLEEFKNEIQSSNNSTQSHMNGVVNAAVSKIGEKVVGVESKIDEIKGQIGIGNKLEELHQEIRQSAGRDINYMPRETVNLVLGITGGLFALLTTAITILGRNARKREQDRTAQERENVKYWQAIAMEAISRLGAEKSRDILPSRGSIPPMPQ
jgi:hypothetical protein